MTSIAKFKEALPHAFYLDAGDKQALQNYLIGRQWISAGNRVRSVTKAGDGNMNCVLRVQLSNLESFIIKQSRPWVEKFPEIAAPVERADAEGLFYRETGTNRLLAKYSPKLIHADSDSHVLMIEDLGVGLDLSRHYHDGSEIGGGTLRSLVDYLSSLHNTFTREKCGFYIENSGMRELNAEHIFRFPFNVDNGLDLDAITPGLEEVARKFRDDSGLRQCIEKLERRYMQNGETLLHGDFYPGSLIQTDNGIKVIDSEFCFFGDAEFDLGVFQANLLLAQQPQVVLEAVIKLYSQPQGFSLSLYRQYTGIEILRRLLGLAQLPIRMDLAGKAKLLELGRRLLVEN